MRMIRMLPIAALLCSCTDYGRGQNPANPPTFEVAAIKLCEQGTLEPPGQSRGMVRYTYPGGRFDAKATTVEFLLE